MIRDATVWDALTALSLGESYVEEVMDYVNVPYDPEAAVGRMAEALHDERQLFILSITSEGYVAGMLWAICAPLLPWSSCNIALDTIVYVKPEYRGTRHGLDLVRAYESWAIDKGASEIRLSVASGIHEDKTGNFYKKLGYEHLGSQYRRKLLCH